MGWLKKNLTLNNHTEILFDVKDIEQDDDGAYGINIAYRRVSTDKQAEEGLGLDAQKDSIVSYCQYNHFDNCLLVTDDGYTGTNLDRPGLQTIIGMINDFNDGLTNIRINMLIVPRIDRLGRSLIDMLQFIEDYLMAKDSKNKSKINHNKKDINFVSIKEQFCKIDRNDPSSKLMLQLFGSLAEYDRDIIVEKLKIGRDKRIASGKWHGGGNVPYGYRYDKKSGTLKVVPEEKEKVIEIFRLYTDEKLSPQKIADMLGFKGDRIITQILQRRSMLGYVSVNGVEYKGLHEPLISQELFDAAQDEMKSRSVVRGESHYLLTGLVYCGVCGAKMRYQKWDPKTGECKLVCYSQQPSKKYLVKDANCDNERYWQSDIENAVINSLFEMTYLNDDSVTKKVSTVSVVENLEKEIEKERIAINKLYNKYAESSDNDEQLWNIIEQRRERKIELEATLKSESRKNAIAKKVNNAKSILRNLKSTWEYMTPEEKQSVCRELIDRIVINKGGVVDVHLKLQQYLIKNAS